MWSSLRSALKEAAGHSVAALEFVLWLASVILPAVGRGLLAVLVLLFLMDLSD